MNIPQPQPSAAVILLDPQRGQGEPFGVFLLRRRAQSRFMPNRFVFPGGRVEPGDGDDPWSPQALQICALRELWEEAGVILAKNPAGPQAAWPPAAACQAARQAMQASGASLAQTLAGLGLAPRPEALTPYARWITPLARPQRFDTQFYLALMPVGQEADSDQLETSEGLWRGPAQALRENREGRVELAPPQVRILGDLAAQASLEALWGRRPADQPVLPVLWAGDGQRIILLPDDPDYPAQAPADPGNPGQPCPAHQATRLVHQEGRWLPHRACHGIG
ncbi:MAG: NUDIX hydrolase [Pseudomonadota bacterium]